MALSNNQFSKDENKKGYSVNVYSDYSFANPNSKVDQTRLSSTFCLGLLKLEIAPKEQNSDKPYPTYDSKAGVAVYLSHTKALILLEEMEAMEADPSIATSVGVDSGSGEKQGIIQISNGAEFGTTNRCVIIRKIGIDSNGGGYVSASFATELKEDDYHYSIRNFNADNPTEFDKIFHNDIEWTQLKTLLRQFVIAQTNAVAYSVMEQMKYNNSRVNTKLDLIMEKNGIEKKSYGGNYNNSSIFQNGGSNNSKQSSIDDINDLM